MRFLLNRDTIGGIVLLALAGAFISKSLDYQIGSAFRMGPGYFPLALGIVLAVLSLFIVVAGVRKPIPIELPVLRPFTAVVSSILVFSVVMAFTGLVPAVVSSVFVSALGDRESKLLSTLGLAAVLSLTSWLIFAVALGMPLPLFW